MEKIQVFALEEIIRQNRIANRTKNLCEDKLGQLQIALEEVISFCSRDNHMQCKL